MTSPADTLTVTTAALTSIAVTPANPTVAKGLTEQFTATGTYSDDTTADLTSQVTWASATPSVATITSSRSGHGAGHRHDEHHRHARRRTSPARPLTVSHGGADSRSP